MAYAAQLMAMQRIQRRSLYITGGLTKPTLDAAHLTVANGHTHDMLLNFFFLLTPRLLDPTQTRDAMPLPVFLLTCRPTNGVSF